MNFKHFLVLIIFCYLKSNAQINYDCELIPTTLKSRANAIIRYNETTVDMRSETNVGYMVKNAITVFNKAGENKARLVIFMIKAELLKV